jgi:hypothetical protein
VWTIYHRADSYLSWMSNLCANKNLILGSGGQTRRFKVLQGYVSLELRLCCVEPTFRQNLSWEKHLTKKRYREILKLGPESNGRFLYTAYIMPNI